ncbi:glycosyltransferase family 4 protein [Halorubrum tropicale]|uniref:glycosyltransferase family 4 protein n=1 Tax=Halorubrum tropicale TaxID=1765655 RepID=UPI00097F9E86|nr:glycosyltransferase family 1 protein [Halorubrum tropicale]
MYVAINARVLSKPEPAGVSRYTRELLVALANRDDEISYLVFGVDTLPPELREYNCIENAKCSPPAASGLRAQFWEQVTLPRVLRHHNVDLCHSTAGVSPILADIPTVVTVHDISPITHPEWFSRRYATLYRVLTPLALKSANHVVTISNFSKSEITATYPWISGSVSSVYNGLTPIPEHATECVADVEQGSYLLFVGSINPRKNITRLLDAYAQYRDRVDNPLPLVIAGSQRDVFAAIDRPPIDNVHTLGFVSDEKRNWLYHNSTALLFPSLYEGFGLPIIEAMDCGTPVLTSDRGAMAEIAGNAAVLVDPTDVDAISSGIEQIATNSSFRRSLIESGRERATRFTWMSTAEKMVSIYRQTLDTYAD